MKKRKLIKALEEFFDCIGYDGWRGTSAGVRLDHFPVDSVLHDNQLGSHNFRFLYRAYQKAKRDASHKKTNR